MISTNLDVKHLTQSSTRPQTSGTGKCSDRQVAADGVCSSPRPWGVVAGNDIPAGVSVAVGNWDAALGRDLIAHTLTPEGAPSRCIKVFWRNKHLETNSDGVANAWATSVRSARDRHEQNLELLRGKDGLVARTLREIGRGEQLLVWYEEGLARELCVPILTLSHIRGHQSYVCTGCATAFTHPNILKAHIFLQCSQAATAPTSTTESLVPFHQLLQTICRGPESTAWSGSERRHAKKVKHSAVSLASKPATPFHQPGWANAGCRDSDSTYRSAFRTLPSSSHGVKLETASDDVLMTPDSSTDQNSALNLSVKHGIKQGLSGSGGDSALGLRSWNIFAAQQMMSPTIAVPFDYPALAGCYSTIPPHFHPLSVQLLGGQTSLQTSHHYTALMESRVGCNGEYQLTTSQADDFQDCGGLPASNPHSSRMSPSVRHLRHGNPYSFSLPSDKEPLDMLPQAYFANKSKKGHLCLCCGKLYSRKYGLKIHMRTHNGYKPLKCKICSRPFGDPSNLNKHVRLHAQGETPYRCEYCGKVLVRRRDLERHVRSRHPMGCLETDEGLPLCESSPDSSPISVSTESPDRSHTPKQSSFTHSTSSV